MFAQWGDQETVLRDNLFDGCAVQDASVAGTNGAVAITHDHNAYLFASTNNLPAGSSDILLNAFQYGVGSQGIYYQISTDLIDLGSRSATDAGLSYFTVSTNEATEDDSTVDIGYHYPSSTVDASLFETSDDTAVLETGLSSSIGLRSSSLSLSSQFEQSAMSAMSAMSVNPPAIIPIGW